jgi:hypothetical protein
MEQDGGFVEDLMATGKKLLVKNDTDSDESAWCNSSCESSSDDEERLPTRKQRRYHRWFKAEVNFEHVDRKQLRYRQQVKD